jgi:hypothetical protein
MLETEAELDALQELLDRSRSGATEHLRGIIDDQRALSARDIASLLQDMKVLSPATVTARGEPRISAVDGHFLHGTWTWSTDGPSAKARHLAVRPAVREAERAAEPRGCRSSGPMVTNRSAPPDRVLPHITYRDVAAASEWLTAVFGFAEHYRYGPPGAPC